MAGLEFSNNQKFALYALIGLSAIGLSISYARNSLSSNAGGVVLREPTQDASTRIIASDSDAIPRSNPGKSSAKVVFHVAGCVKAPAVYSLPAGSRVADAVTAAGGAKDDADLQALNLAAKIEDGSRIYVPSIQESKAGLSGQLVSGASSAAKKKSTPAGGKLKKPGEGLVHINSADSDELQRLPGIGPVTAQKIIQYRARLGRFVKPEQLLDVKGIGPKTFEKMRPFVTL